MKRRAKGKAEADHESDGRNLVPLASPLLYGLWSCRRPRYAFNEIVPDSANRSAFRGGSACPVHAHQLPAPQPVFRWARCLQQSNDILTQTRLPLAA